MLCGFVLGTDRNFVMVNENIAGFDSGSRCRDSPPATWLTLLPLQIHVPKCGGVTASRAIPSLTKRPNCNFEHKIVQCCLNVSEVARQIGRGPLFTDTCGYFVFEWNRFQLEELMERYGHTQYDFLTVLRNPALQWFSAFQHQYKNSKVSTLEDYLHNGPMISKLNGLPIYNLHNFQLNHFARNSSVVEGIRFIRDRVFWLGLLEEMEMSHALLMCQLYDNAYPKLVQKYLLHRNKAYLFNYTMSADILGRFYKQNVEELRFYSLAVGIFWQRVRAQRKCLERSG
jgi:hypothetical protein